MLIVGLVVVLILLARNRIVLICMFSKFGILISNWFKSLRCPMNLGREARTHHARLLCLGKSRLWWLCRGRSSTPYLRAICQQCLCADLDVRPRWVLLIRYNVSGCLGDQRLFKRQRIGKVSGKYFDCWNHRLFITESWSRLERVSSQQRVCRASKPTYSSGARLGTLSSLGRIFCHRR